jgi:probable Rubsico expression protein CbbX
MNAAMSPTEGTGFAMRRNGQPALDEREPVPDPDPARQSLEPGEEVDVVEERRRLDIDTVLDRLDRELVGLVPVKTRIRQLAALLLVDRLRGRYGLTSSRPTLHMCFTGGPGTGKTTVALRIAELLKSLGYLEKGHLVTVTRDELVGQYIGHTAPKTKEVLKRAIGGVLFIDEAYYLHRAENERDYGAEAIEILLQVMENQREDLVVILAGYKDRMDTFFQANPGMSSRVAHHVDFPDYTIDELCAIAELMLAEQRYEFSSEARDVFRRYLERRISQPRFANARSVRNALERARLRQANRIVSSDQRCFRRQDLMRIEPDDILASKVMAEEPDPRKDDARCA